MGYAGEGEEMRTYFCLDAAWSVLRAWSGVGATVQRKKKGPAEVVQAMNAHTWLDDQFFEVVGIEWWSPAQGRGGQRGESRASADKTLLMLSAPALRWVMLKYGGDVMLEHVAKASGAAGANLQAGACRTQGQFRDLCRRAMSEIESAKNALCGSDVGAAGGQVEEDPGSAVTAIVGAAMPGWMRTAALRSLMGSQKGAVSDWTRDAQKRGAVNLWHELMNPHLWGPQEGARTEFLKFVIRSRGDLLMQLVDEMPEGSGVREQILERTNNRARESMTLLSAVLSLEVNLFTHHAPPFIHPAPSPQRRLFCSHTPESLHPDCGLSGGSPLFQPVSQQSAHSHPTNLQVSTGTYRNVLYPLAHLLFQDTGVHVLLASERARLARDRLVLPAPELGCTTWNLKGGTVGVGSTPTKCLDWMLQYPDTRNLCRGRALVLVANADGAMLGNKGEVTGCCLRIVNAIGAEGIPLEYFTVSMSTGGDDVANAMIHHAGFYAGLARLVEEGYEDVQKGRLLQVIVKYTNDGKADRSLAGRPTAASKQGCCAMCGVDQGSLGNFLSIHLSNIPLASAEAAVVEFEQEGPSAGKAKNVENIKAAAAGRSGQLGLPIMYMSDTKDIAADRYPCTLHHKMRYLAIVFCEIYSMSIAEGHGDRAMATIRQCKIKIKIAQPTSGVNKHVASFHGRDSNKALANLDKILEAGLGLDGDDEDLDSSDPHVQARMQMLDALTLALDGGKSFILRMTSHKTRPEDWLDMWLHGICTGQMLSACLGPSAITPSIHALFTHDAIQGVHALKEVGERSGLDGHLSPAAFAEDAFEHVHLLDTNAFARGTMHGGCIRPQVGQKPMTLKSGEDGRVAERQIRDTLKRRWAEISLKKSNPRTDSAACVAARHQRYAKFGQGACTEYGDMPAHDGYPQLPGSNDVEGTASLFPIQEGDASSPNTGEQVDGAQLLQDDGDADGDSDRGSIHGPSAGGAGDQVPAPGNGGVVPAPSAEDVMQLDDLGGEKVGDESDDDDDDDVDVGEAEGGEEDEEEDDEEQNRGDPVVEEDNQHSNTGMEDDVDDNSNTQCPSNWTALDWNKERLDRSWAHKSAPFLHSNTDAAASVERSLRAPKMVTSGQLSGASVGPSGSEDVFQMDVCTVVAKIDSQNNRITLEESPGPHSERQAKRRVIFNFIEALCFQDDGKEACLKIRLQAEPCFEEQVDVDNIAAVKSKKQTNKLVPAAPSKRKKAQYKWMNAARVPWTKDGAATTYSLWILKGRTKCFGELKSIVECRRRDSSLAAEEWNGARNPTFKGDHDSGIIPPVTGLEPGVAPIRSHSKQVKTFAEKVQGICIRYRERSKSITGTALFDLSVQGEPMLLCVEMLKECREAFEQMEKEIDKTTPRVRGRQPLAPGAGGSASAAGDGKEGETDEMQVDEASGGDSCAQNIVAGAATAHGEGDGGAMDTS